MQPATQGLTPGQCNCRLWGLTPIHLFLPTPHGDAGEPCCSRTLALRNDIWVPSIGACRSIYDNTIVCDILEPPTHALPTTWRHTAKWGGGPRPAGRASPVEGQPLRRGTLHACYWNSLLGALTQALILTAAHADTSQFKSEARKVADVV